MIPLTQHAAARCAQRGIRAEFLDGLMRMADVDAPIGLNCRLLRVSRRARLGCDATQDKLARYAVIWSDDSQSVVTVFPIESGNWATVIARQAARADNDRSNIALQSR